MTQVRFNKYYPIAFLYFFLNGVFLPHGLLYTTILTPFFLIWLFKFPSFKYVFLYFIIFTPFAFIHFSNGVDNGFYIKSSFLFFSVYVFTLAFYQFLTECKTLRIIYRKLLTANVLFVVFAFIALAIPSLRHVFWYYNEITPGVNTVRLQALTYEPSYYSVLFMPIALYYYLKLAILKLPNPIITFLLLTIPILLALSFGNILGLLLALIFTLLWGYSRFFDTRQTFYLLVGAAFFIFLLAFVLIIFHNNVFVIRFTNIMEGKDISFNGRTTDSFDLGWNIAGQKSHLFGVGPGQTKVFGQHYFNEFYQMGNKVVEVTIPNSLGDTLAVFGLAGLLLKLGLEIFFFFKTRVYHNYYRLSMFLFIFIYQFTGSFITNIAEYAIWAIAFHPGIFEEFDKTNFRIRLMGKKQITSNS